MNLFNIRPGLLQIALLALLVVLSSRILINGLADYYLQKALDGDMSSIDSVVSWHADHSKGNYLKAKTLETTQPKNAEALLYQVMFANPADARPLTALARILSPADSVMADSLVSLASKKMPANKSVHLHAANYWIDRQQLSKALDAWHMALSIDQNMGKQIFPVFLRVLENRDIQHYLLPYALNPPRWWESFVAFAVRQAHDVSVVSRLQKLRSQSETELSAVERRMLVERYIKEGQWQQAYLVWAEGLSVSHRGDLAAVYDGSFEYVDPGEPFGWQLSSTRYTKTAVRRTIGVHGQSALSVNFDNEEVRYRHLYQYLLLPPGEYLFTATKRTDKLTGRGRLKWFVRCSTPGSSVAGESRPILPSIEWEKMQFKFSVPSTETCGSQTLSLETIGKHAFDHKLSGVIWIDDIHVERLRSQ